MILAGLLVGFLVSLIEAACTGQVYVPILAVLAKSGVARAWLYLLLYNAIFITPLLIILGVSLWGISSEKLQAFFKTHLGSIKLATAILFFVMAGFLILQ